MVYYTITLIIAYGILYVMHHKIIEEELTMLEGVIILLLWPIIIPLGLLRNKNNR